MYLHPRLLKVYERHVERFLVENETRRGLLTQGGIPPDRIAVLPQPFDASGYDELPFDGDRFLYFGRLDPDKGVELLIEAAAVAGVDVDIVGRGTETERLERLSRDLGPGRGSLPRGVYGADVEALGPPPIPPLLPSPPTGGTPEARLH